MGSLLNIIQTKLNAPKNQFNKFGGYKYRSLEDIFEALKPILKETGASIVIGDDIDIKNDRVYVKATATLYDKDMKVVATNSAFAREQLAKKGMDEAQITGATSSYARKYALNGLFAIDDTKDADATNKHGKDSDEVAVQDVVALIQQTNTNMEQFLGYFGAKSIDEVDLKKAKSMLLKKLTRGNTDESKKN